MRLEGPFVVKRRGCALHYWTAGPRSAPAVVFSHGFTMDHDLFSPQIGEVARTYRVIVWDVRGHGRSQPLGEGFSLFTATSDLTAILESEGIERAAHIGHSLGGYIAQDLEFRYPERVGALVALGTTSLTHPIPKWLHRVAPLTTYALRVWPESWTTTQVGWIAGLGRAARIHASNACGNVQRDARVRVWTAILDGFRDVPHHRIRCPLLIMHGSLDLVVGAGLVPLLASGWAAREPLAQYVVIPKAGHNANLDNPSFTNQALLAFLDRHWLADPQQPHETHPERRPGDVDVP